MRLLPSLPVLTRGKRTAPRPVGAAAPAGCIRQHRKALYTALWMGGKLNAYLAGIDRQAQEMFFQLVNEYAHRQGIMERLKAENQIEWVGRMNNCKAQAEEIIMAELIYC